MPNNIFLKSSGFAMPDKNGHPFPDRYGATAEAVLTDCLSPEGIANAPAKHCGIAWKKNQPGEFGAEGTPMDRAGNRYLRYYMVEAAGSVIQHCRNTKPFMTRNLPGWEHTSTNEHPRWPPVN